MVPPSVLVISHFLILSRRPIGTALGSSCLKAGTDITGLVLILMISDQWTYTCFHHNTPFYAFISYILTCVRFPDFFIIGEWHLCCRPSLLYCSIRCTQFSNWVRYRSEQLRGKFVYHENRQHLLTIYSYRPQSGHS